jgi:transposase
MLGSVYIITIVCYNIIKELVILCCKKCGSENHVKSGVVKGEQRYKCKDCGCQFVPTRHHGRPKKDKLTAVWLYVHGLSFRTIAKFLKVSPKAVHDWVKAFAKANYIKPEPQGEAVIVELDEMWHFLHSKKDRSGYGRLIAAIPANSSTGNAEGATMLHFQGCMKD